VNSRRKYDKIESELGFKPVQYFSVYFNGAFGYLIQEDFDKVKKIGVTKARIDQSKIHPCWYYDPQFYPNQPYDVPDFNRKSLTK